MPEYKAVHFELSKLNELIAELKKVDGTCLSFETTSPKSKQQAARSRKSMEARATAIDAYNKAVRETQSYLLEMEAAVRKATSSMKGQRVRNALAAGCMEDRLVVRLAKTSTPAAKASYDAFVSEGVQMLPFDDLQAIAER